MPCGIHTSFACAAPASTACWKAAVESAEPFGSAPKSVTDSDPAGRFPAGATSSKSAR